jgi:membrane-associated phospholipid phosphatase
MSVVAFTHLFFAAPARFQSPIFAIPFICLALLIGLSRVYSLSRFPHQVIASYGTGFIGLVIAEMVYTRLQFDRFD